MYLIYLISPIAVYMHAEKGHNKNNNNGPNGHLFYHWFIKWHVAS